MMAIIGMHDTKKGAEEMAKMMRKRPRLKDVFVRKSKRTKNYYIMLPYK